MPNKTPLKIGQFTRTAFVYVAGAYVVTHSVVGLYTYGSLAVTAARLKREELKERREIRKAEKEAEKASA